jgi:nucleoside-diphosphate-sugar epimerase
VRILVIGTGMIGGAAVAALSDHAAFPGFTQVTAAAVGQAYVKAVEGVQTGQVYPLDGQ